MAVGQGCLFPAEAQEKVVPQEGLSLLEKQDAQFAVFICIKNAPLCIVPASASDVLQLEVPSSLAWEMGESSPQALQSTKSSEACIMRDLCTTV